MGYVDSSGRELVDVGGADITVDLGSVQIEDHTTVGQKAAVDAHGSIKTTTADSAGADAVGAKTTAAAMPAGGSGLLGWLSAIANYLAGILTINNSQVAGTSVDVNSGNKSAGTQRVVLATDQPAVPASAKAQTTSGVVVLCSAVTGTGGQAGVSMDGYNGAQTLEVAAAGTVAAQAVSFKIDGSLDNSNWYQVRLIRIDGQTTATLITSDTITPGNGTIRQTYAIQDAYKFYRVNPTANTLGTGLTVNDYGVPE